jgi:hypothetical protein
MGERADRELLLRALSIIDRLDAGWQPGEAELEEARYVQSWAILPREERAPFSMIGIAWSLPVRIDLIAAPLIALDRDQRWARLWDEWVAIGEPDAAGPAIDANEIRAASVAWLSATLRQLPLHA